MTDFAYRCAPLELQASMLLALSAAVVQTLIWWLRPASPTIQRIVWLSVLLQGLLLCHLPVEVAWYTRELAAVSPPTVMPDGGSRDEAPHSPPLPSESIAGSLAADASPTEPSKTVTPVETAGSFDWTAILTMVWLAGMVGLLGLFSLSYGRFLRRLSRSRPAPENWTRPWQRLLADEGVRRPIPLRISYAVYDFPLMRSFWPRETTRA